MCHQYVSERLHRYKLSCVANKLTKITDKLADFREPWNFEKRKFVNRKYVAKELNINLFLILFMSQLLKRSGHRFE